MFGASIYYTEHLFTVYLLGASKYAQSNWLKHRSMHRSTIFGMYEYAHNSKYMFFRACISESRSDCMDRAV